MGLFKKKTLPPLPFDPKKQEAAVRKSICTGEMTAGFIDRETGAFHELMRVDQAELEAFMRRCGVDHIKTIY